MIKKVFLIIILSVCGVMAVSAQGKDGMDRKQMMKELQEFKMKFLAQEMELREDQQAKFFELYNEMSVKRRDCMRAAWRMERKVKKASDATEADYQAAAEAMNKAKSEDVAIEKSYDEKFSEFLSPKQIYKMKAAEQEFRNKMSEMRNKKAKHPTKL
ncbi:MAG: periplasmic heavy metal sensor [Muribaculaceae bacterium]|nr:periplasmic heavy metal sensor [Muribaculaceae bacterium]